MCSRKLTQHEYLRILQSEMLTATGCTEPIAIALCASVCRSLLPDELQKLQVYCSGNIIKNTHSVIVPNSGGGKGIALAASMGAFCGNKQLGLRLLETATEETITQAKAFADSGNISVHHVRDVQGLYIRCEGVSKAHSSLAEIKNDHTHFSRLECDGRVLLSESDKKSDSTSHSEVLEYKRQLRFHDIWEFAKEFDFTSMDEFYDLFNAQLKMNLNISKEGMANGWGQEVGRNIEKNIPAEMRQKLSNPEIVARTAAASDARMNGCALPVVINSGSGNQGMTVSLPCIFVAEREGKPLDELFRALFISNLIAIEAKFYIGNLSAYCGVVTAASAAIAGVSYLMGDDEEVAQRAVSNALAISSGTICDGAKSSCAGKIAVALTNAFLALDMARAGHGYLGGEGIVGYDIDSTIKNVGRLAAEGMKVTDEKILEIMLRQKN